VPSSFLFEYASSQEFSDFLVGRATGSAYPAVRPEDFSSAPVVVPPAPLLERFATVADPVLRLTSALRTQCDQQAEVRDSLLPRLVTGQLDISDIDLGTLTPAEAA
jgi:type I restriction enzyme S subunit